MAILNTFWLDLIYGTLFAFLAEGITVTYVYFLYFLFDYIKDESAPITDGVYLCVVYGLAIFFSAFFRNYYIFLGYNMAIKMRKAIVGSMYDKVGKLSNKSLTETNSGKLITIISGDIFNVERAICIFPILPAAPLITLLCLFYIARSNGLMYAVYTFIIWVLCMVVQLFINRYTRIYRAQDAMLTDQRMKLINDLVSGIRTIKSYAWENHYLAKIREIRAKQHSTVLKYNVVASIGYAVLSNAGFVVIIVIFIPMWFQGEYISTESAFSMLAMVFFLFLAINALFLWALSTVN